MAEPPRRRCGRRLLTTVAVAFAILIAAGALLWNSPYAFMGLARAIGHRVMGVREQVVVIDGHRWPYLEGGDPAAPTTLLLHGYGTSKDAMMQVMSWLVSSNRAIAPDLPGFGMHDEHAGTPHDGAFYTAQVLAFMDAKGLDQVDLIGTSMGGAIAADLAIRHPERVRRLILLAPAGVRAPVENDFMRAANAGSNPLELRTAEDFDRVVRLVFKHPPPTPGPVRRYFVLEAQRRLAGTDRIIPAIESFVRDGLEGRLGSIVAPTLVVWGDSDAVLDPSMESVFVAQIPGAVGVVVEDAGHVAFSDNPSAVRAAIERFLASTAVPAAPAGPARTDPPPPITPVPNSTPSAGP